MLRFRRVLLAAGSLIFLGACLLPAIQSKTPRQVLTGKAAFGDFTQQKPGTFRKITVADLPQCIAALKKAGVHLRNEIEAGPGGRQLQIEDPDGNPIELFEPAR